MMNKVDEFFRAAVLAFLLAPFAGLAQEPGEQVPQAQAGPDAEEPAEEEGEQADGPHADLSSTGDGWVDERLLDINRYARRYPETFADELQRYQDAPRRSVQSLLEQGWAPGDVYFACALGRVTGRSCRFIVARRGHPAEVGWHALAVELGAAPGSPAFERLKSGIVESYARWGRPLQVGAAPARAPEGEG